MDRSSAFQRSMAKFHSRREFSLEKDESHSSTNPIFRQSVMKEVLNHGIATCLMLEDTTNVSKINEGFSRGLEMNFLSMKFPRTDGFWPDCSITQAARFQEIFMDLVSLYTANLTLHSTFLFDMRYESFLNEGEIEIKKKVTSIISDRDSLSDAAKETLLYHRLVRFLVDELGFHRCSEDERQHIQKMKTRRSPSTEYSSDIRTWENTLSSPMEQMTNFVHNNCYLLRSFVFSKQVDGKPTDSEKERLRTLLEDYGSKEIDLNLPREEELFNKLCQNPGHVFVINGSVVDLCCDAFLLPFGQEKGLNTQNPSGTIFPQWLKKIKEEDQEFYRKLMVGSSEGLLPLSHYSESDNYTRVATPMNWEFFTAELGRSHIPFLVAGEVSMERSSISESLERGMNDYMLPSIEDNIVSLMLTVKEFVKVALKELRENNVKPAFGRDRYLLAVPVVGTKGGGASDITGHIIEKELCQLCKSVAEEEDADCVLVCADAASFALAQRVRLKICPVIKQDDTENVGTLQINDNARLPCFKLLSNIMRNNAFQLAELAAEQNLSFFLGAGVSIPAGGPSWISLLLAIEDQFTKTGAESERKICYDVDWCTLPYADCLERICKERADRFGEKLSMKERICKLLKDSVNHPSLIIAILASIPSKSIITQNYDQLIEKSLKLRNIGEKKRPVVSILPHSPERCADQWILKMHGCVSKPSDVVIHSRDYEEYEVGRMKALGGLVQANLMTSHLLFLGFSMTDPNFLRIIQEVRNALSPE